MHEKISQSCFSFVKYPISSSKLWEILLSVFLVSYLWTPSRILLNIDLFPEILYASPPSSSQQMIFSPWKKKRKTIRQNFLNLFLLLPLAGKRNSLHSSILWSQLVEDVSFSKWECISFSSFIFLWHFEMLCYFKHLHPLHPHSSVLWLITLAKL